jgi:hypothetical protein
MVVVVRGQRSTSEVQALLSFSISFFSFFFHHPLLSSLLLPTDDIA